MVMQSLNKSKRAKRINKTLLKPVEKSHIENIFFTLFFSFYLQVLIEFKVISHWNTAFCPPSNIIFFTYLCKCVYLAQPRANCFLFVSFYAFFQQYFSHIGG
jgi:hypothetical protein